MPVRRGARFRSRLLVRPTRPGTILPGVEPHINDGTGFALAKAGIAGHVTDSRVIAVESIEKYFPPALSGWRALLQVAKPTERALSDVSFTAGVGEAVALISANGAGKSNLLRILAKLITPTRGRATLSRFDVERDSHAY
jgi:ABC-type glutathione transport system ATPase component